MSSEPTPRELLIQLEAAVRRLDEFGNQLNRLTETLSSTYVPRGEYLEARRGDDRRFKEIEDDLEKQASFRRQVAAGFAVGFLLILVGVLFALARIPGVG